MTLSIVCGIIVKSVYADVRDCLVFKSTLAFREISGLCHHSIELGLEVGSKSHNYFVYLWTTLNKRLPLSSEHLGSHNCLVSIAILYIGKLEYKLKYNAYISEQ